MVRKLFYILILISILPLVFSFRGALTPSSMMFDSSRFGLLDDNNNWTGENIFKNITIINYTTFNVTGVLYAEDFCYSNGTCLTQTNDTDTHVKGDDIYLYNTSTIMYLNETKLNETIDARGSIDSLWWNDSGVTTSDRPIYVGGDIFLGTVDKIQFGSSVNQIGSDKFKSNNDITLQAGTTGDHITFNLGTTPYMRLTDTGFVGIRTITPVTELEVNGSITADYYIGDGSLLTGINGDNLGNHIATENLQMSSYNITETQKQTFTNSSYGIWSNSTDMIIGYIGGLA